MKNEIKGLKDHIATKIKVSIKACIETGTQTEKTET